MKGGFLRRLREFLPAEKAGARGERLAQQFLRRKCGFRLLKRNWRNPDDRREEIDLVGMDGTILVFVEVKARTHAEPLEVYYAVDWKKRKVLRRACRAFLKQWGYPQPSFRFDIITVDLSRGKKPGAVRHYPNVLLFGKQ